MFARYDISILRAFPNWLLDNSNLKKQWIISNVVNTWVFLSCFGGIECGNPYFNNSNSSVENSNDDKFLTTSLLVKDMTLLKVRFFSFFSCVGKIFFLFLHTLLSIHWQIMYQSTPVTRYLTSALSRSSSFSNFSFSYRRLFIALQSSLFRIALSSLWFVYGKLKFVNFGTTLNLLQLNKNFVSNEALARFKDSFKECFRLFYGILWCL